METSSSVKHIYLSSEQEEEQPQERITNLQFEQQSRLPRWETRYTVFNEHYLSVETARRGKKLNSYEFDLSFLASQPKRVRKIDGFFCTVAFILLSAAVTTGLMSTAGMSGMIPLLLMSGFTLSLIVAVFRSRTDFVFISKHGRLPLLVLSKRRSTTAGLQTFVSEIIRRIQSTRKNWASKSEFLSAELRQHRHLLEADVLSGKDYEAVKQRILEKHL